MFGLATSYGMNISDLKEIIKKVGGLLVMDGEEPSFVMLSYNHYKELAEEIAEVAVRKESHMSPADLYTHDQSQIGLANYDLPASDNQNGLLVNSLVGHKESEEDRINQLNQEIALLKSEIKQQQLESSGVDIDST